MFPLSALLLLQAPAPAPAPVPAQPERVPPARIELTTPFPVHLGSVGPRDIREAGFGIRSLQNHPFRFRVLDLSIGVSLDEAQLAEPLQPGEVRMIRIKVDPTGMEGAVKGGVRLGTDDPAQPGYILRYDMVVRPEVTVDSPRKSLGDVAPYERPEVRFRFLREGGEPLKLSLAEAVPPHLEAELVHDGVSAELRLTLHPEHLSPGTAAGLDVLKVATNGPKQPLFTLYLDWRIAAAVVPAPSRLVFSDLKTTLLGLELTARDGKPFRILKAEIRGKGFQLIDAPGPESARHVLRIRRTGTNPEAMLEIQCSTLDEPLKVPLRFLDPRAHAARTIPPPAPIDEHHHH
jgi:hypothetical protein